MAILDEDGDLVEFNPAESAISTEDIRNLLHLVCKRAYIELYNKQFPGLIPDSDEFFKIAYGSSFMIAESYIERIITHYYQSVLPFEDDLEPVDLSSFPLDKEITRFFKAQWYINFDHIDHYCGTQPVGDEKEEELPRLQEYFKILKALALKYYPQLEKLPARGFRELERSLYTINYILWIDLRESKDRLLGINKEHYQEMDRLQKEKNEERDRNRKEAESKQGESWIEKWDKMTDEEKDEWERKMEEIERIEDLEGIMRQKLFIAMANKYLKIYPEHKFNYDEFLIKLKKECQLSYRDIFYIVKEMIEHYQQSDEPFYKDRKYTLGYGCYHNYKKLVKKGNMEKLQEFMDGLDEWEKDDIKFWTNVEEMGKTMLAVIYETFPNIINMSANAMKEIKDYVYSFAKFNLKEIFAVRDRLLKVNTEIYEKHDKMVEEIQRKNFNYKK